MRMNAIGQDWTKLDIESPITAALGLYGDTSFHVFMGLGFDKLVQSAAD